MESVCVVSERPAGGGDGAVVGARRSGVAPVKPEYILHDHKPELVYDYVAADVKDQLLGQPDEASQPADEPPVKKAKVKGQNKARPRYKDGQASRNGKLCSFVASLRECRYGDKCMYSHDVVSFVEGRLATLRGGCYVYGQLGRCPFGLACMYGKDHIRKVGDTYVSIANEDLDAAGAASATRLPAQLNQLKKDVQTKLRKKSYDFGRAVKALSTTEAYMKNRSPSAVAGASAAASAEACSGPSSSNATVAASPACHAVVPPSQPVLLQPQPPVHAGGDCSGDAVDPIQLLSKEGSASVFNPNEGIPDHVVSALPTAEASALPACTVATVTSESTATADVLGGVDPVVGNSSGLGLQQQQQVDGSRVHLQQSVNGDGGLLPLVGGELASTAADAQRIKTCGALTDDGLIKCRPSEKQRLDFANKLYLAPLTTVGNLPFRRVCKRLGADITCGEMAMATNILQCQSSEWALLKKHPSEDFFGVQLCGAFADTMTKCAQLIEDTCEVDFIDINVGCPIDLVCNKGAGSALMRRQNKFEDIVRSMSGVMTHPLTVKIRTGICQGENFAHTLIPRLRDWGVSLVTLHGRTKEQRYTKSADWNYIAECTTAAAPMPLFGNGDILSYEDYYYRMETSGVSGIMMARGALIKPWLFTEIKERRHWDISSSERFDILKEFTNYGLEHWGSDAQGVENTRRFLLEWLSFTCRYIPVGILEVLPQKINDRPPFYRGRDELETLLSSSSCASWIKISEMLLGPVPDGFTFLPKHKANAYS